MGGGFQRTIGAFARRGIGERARGKADMPLVIVALALSGIGLLFIYSASSYSADVQFGDAFHYVKTQAVALALGLFAMLGLSFVDISKIKKATIPLYVVGLVLLGMVFLPVIGVESYGAKRWLNLGFFTIQPSEYAKFFMVMMLSLVASKLDMSKFRSVIAMLLVGGAVCVLLMLEPNMSITMCAVAVIFIMLFVGGARIKHLLLLVVPVVIGAVILVVIEPYRMQRLLAFLDPWKSPLEEGYQLIQSYYALGSGGLFGVGLFASRQKYLFLPFAESDFILSVIGEETGLIGVAVIIGLFLTIAVRGIKIARQAQDRYSCYLAAGITAVTTVQALLNVAVVCGAVPPTGLPLPFVSAGGSSLVAYLGAIGVLLSISRSRLPFVRVDTFDDSERETVKHPKKKISIR
ncbi:MAG: putative lipid II flippase FtsW [Clostridiales bacterium]|nr:putative lipid II flippase FtsW [Clostridiales bacterium]